MNMILNSCTSLSIRSVANNFGSPSGTALPNPASVTAKVYCRRNTLTSFLVVFKERKGSTTYNEYVNLYTNMLL